MYNALVKDDVKFERNINIEQYNAVFEKGNFILHKAMLNKIEK